MIDAFDYRFVAIHFKVSFEQLFDLDNQIGVNYWSGRSEGECITKSKKIGVVFESEWIKKEMESEWFKFRVVQVQKRGGSRPKCNQQNRQLHNVSRVAFINTIYLAEVK